MNKKFVAKGAIFMALGVALGALSSHGLKGLEQNAIYMFSLGVQYQIWHAMGLIAIGLIAGKVANRQIQLAGHLMFVGTILFSGGLYFYAISDIDGIKMIIPIGGFFLIASWIAIIWAIFAKDQI